MTDREPWLTVEEEETPEGTTIVLRGTFKSDDEPPVIVLQGDLFALLLTIMDSRTREVVGDWENKSVLGENGGSFQVPDGGTDPTRFTLRIPPTDMLLLGAGAFEQRRFCFAWTYNGGVDAGYAEARLVLRKRPVPA